MWSKKDTHLLLVGMQTCTATRKIRMVVSQEDGNIIHKENVVQVAQRSIKQMLKNEIMKFRGKWMDRTRTYPT